MKAAVHTRYGPPEVLSIAEVAKPVPSDHEVLIKIRATTVTVGDSRMRSFTVPRAMWSKSSRRIATSTPVTGRETSSPPCDRRARECRNQPVVSDPVAQFSGCESAEATAGRLGPEPGVGQGLPSTDCVSRQ